jgi:hypothetical protein
MADFGEFESSEDPTAGTNSLVSSRRRPADSDARQLTFDFPAPERNTSPGRASFPSIDFLAREKELLGDDAALFESAVGGGGSGSGATIEDDFGDFTEDKGTSALTDAAAAFVGFRELE